MSDKITSKEALMEHLLFSQNLYSEYDMIPYFHDDDCEMYHKNMKLKQGYNISQNLIELDKQNSGINTGSKSLILSKRSFEVVGNSGTSAVGEDLEISAKKNMSLNEYNAIARNPISQEKVDKIVNSVLENKQVDDKLRTSVRELAEKTLISHALAGSYNQSTGESKTPFSQGLLPLRAPDMPKPTWHSPWKLMRVISGHTGWVRCVALDPTNTWFATGSADRMIKIWDLAKGTLKLSLTGHISTVRGVTVSDRHPYLFSCGEDKSVKCWDLEQNKVVRHYHGHLSGVYCISLHPTLDILVTGGRDSVARVINKLSTLHSKVWDIRTKANIHTLTGHTNTVACVATQATEPQIISGSHDSTIRFWDIVAGRSLTTLTNHKKSVRSIVLHPSMNCMASGAPDNIKQWKFPNGEFLQNLSGQHAIVNTLAINMDGVLVSGADNGSMYFWDWKSGYNFQTHTTTVQPGSLESEAGIFDMAFDLSGSRLITCEADKTIKIYKEDETATEETHPINWKPTLSRKRF